MFRAGRPGCVCIYIYALNTTVLDKKYAVLTFKLPLSCLLGGWSEFSFPWGTSCRGPVPGNS